MTTITPNATPDHWLILGPPTSTLTSSQSASYAMLSEAMLGLAPETLADAVYEALRDRPLPDDVYEALANKIGRIPHEKQWEQRNG